MVKHTRDLRRTVVVVLPNSMAERSVFNTPIVKLMGLCPDIHWRIVTSSDHPCDQDEVSDAEIISCYSIYDPLKAPVGWAARICFSVTLRILRALRAGYENLAYRFNHLNDFAGHRHKTMMSKSRMLRESKAGNYVHKALGRPFRNSKYLYRCLYRLHYATWQCNDPKIEAFYDLTKPVLTVLWHVQHLRTKAYALASRNRNIPAVAVLGSWDRPTSKGPIAPGMAKYLVNTAVMKSELKAHHAVPDADIVNVGWPQMDEFFTNRVGCDRQQFLRSQGFATDRALLVYAGNATRLGSHEPDIVEYLVDAVGRDQFAQPCQLLIRAHPQDPQWHKRFGRFEDSQNVYLQEPQMGNLDYLANLLRHADILLATQGTVTLDAIAMDTCVVNVAFDGNRNPCPEESIALFYEMDHYRPVVESGGVCIVRSFKELEGGINAYLNNPALHAEGRVKLRELELKPMDGMSSSRIVEVIRSHALV